MERVSNSFPFLRWNVAWYLFLISTHYINITHLCLFIRCFMGIGWNNFSSTFHTLSCLFSLVNFYSTFRFWFKVTSQESFPGCPTVHSLEIPHTVSQLQFCVCVFDCVFFPPASVRVESSSNFSSLLHSQDLKPFPEPCVLNKHLMWYFHCPISFIYGSKLEFWGQVIWLNFPRGDLCSNVCWVTTLCTNAVLDTEWVT